MLAEEDHGTASMERDPIVFSAIKSIAHLFEGQSFCDQPSPDGFEKLLIVTVMVPPDFVVDEEIDRFVSVLRRFPIVGIDSDGPDFTPIVPKVRFTNIAGPR